MENENAIDAFAALAHDTRLRVYRLLVRAGPKGLPATEISKALTIVPSTLSGHLAMMKRVNLLTAIRHSREIHYSANLSTINRLVTFLLSDCCNGKVENCSEILDLLRSDKVA
jgi:DNA-binding transcriptional ArsR family regulator